MGSIHGFTSENRRKKGKPVSVKTLPKTAPEVIREAASLIAAKGFGLMRGNTIADRLGVFGINLSTAVSWAVHGSPCRPRDLTALEAEHVAEVLDLLEDDFRMPVDAYERRYADALPQHISHDLRCAAWNLENALGMAS
jgi:hypothetical protein